MRPARPWSWALLVLLLVVLTAAATAADGGGPSSIRHDAPERPALGSGHPIALDAVAVLAERLSTSPSSEHRSPTVPLGVILAALALSALLSVRPAPGSSTWRFAVRRPGGSGCRAPPLAAS